MCIRDRIGSVDFPRFQHLANARYGIRTILAALPSDVIDRFLSHVLSDKDGKTIRLTKSAFGKKSKINLEDLVNADVSVAGQGYESGAGKKKRVILKKIETIEKADSAG